MMKSHANLIEFTAQAMDDGFDEVVQKDWAPDLVVKNHTHPFDVRVQVNSGQVQLSLASGTQTYGAGQSFTLSEMLSTQSNMVQKVLIFG
jgi:hypothetical protein